MSIGSSEKQFFKPDEVKTEISTPTEVDGVFVSLNKETNRGRFRMKNGKSVPYRLVGENPSLMHSDFAHRGPTRVECLASFDSNLELVGLGITRVVRLQTEFPFDGPSDPTAHS